MQKSFNVNKSRPSGECKKKVAYGKNTREIRIFLSMLENHSSPVKVINYIVYLPNILFAFQISLSQWVLPKGFIKGLSFEELFEWRQKTVI